MSGMHYDKNLCSGAICIECCGCEQYEKAINEIKNIIKNYHAHINDDAMADIFSDLEQLKKLNK